ncbi:MAG: helix-turn-helix domain-containing protein [Thermodesulfovibrionales bacterium]
MLLIMLINSLLVNIIIGIISNIMLTINQATRAMREMKGLSQAEVAASMGTNQSSLARFESEKTKLPMEKVEEIATHLKINTKYFDNPTLSLFNAAPGELLRMIIPERRVTMELDLSFFTDVLAEVSNRLDVIFLTPEGGLLSKITYFSDIPIYSIAARDNHNNIFLFRRRTASHLLATIVKVNELQLSMAEKAARKKSVITFSYRRIDAPLYDRIKAWNRVERQDIEPLFGAQEDICILTEEEAALIRDIRMGHHRIDEIRNVLQPHRRRAR